jgi:hypothetical protein
MAAAIHHSGLYDRGRMRRVNGARPYRFLPSSAAMSLTMRPALRWAIVIGSGIMGERLAGGNLALALLGNTLSTGAGLVVLITISGPVSGAHFNPP